MDRKVIIFDIDGTLADIEHRRHFVSGGNKDWKSFNASMHLDLLNTPVYTIYKALRLTDLDMVKYEFILCTGRSEDNSKETHEWLYYNDIRADQIYFRKSGDSRADHIVKKEFLEDVRSQGKEVLFVVDDRDSVVKMWRENGVVCLQCAEGNF